MTPKYQVILFKDLNQEKTDELLKAHASFEVVSVPSFQQSAAVTIVERRCEALGMRCRVYQKGRTIIGGALAFVNPLIGWGILGASGVHKLATLAPDYEIRKEFGTGIVVTYKK